VNNRLTSVPAKLPLSWKVKLDKGEPLEEERNFVIFAEAVHFYTAAKSCEEARVKLEAFLEKIEKQGDVVIQVSYVQHLADDAEWNEGVC